MSQNVTLSAKTSAAQSLTVEVLLEQGRDRAMSQNVTRSARILASHSRRAGIEARASGFFELMRSYGPCPFSHPLRLASRLCEPGTGLSRKEKASKLSHRGIGCKLVNSKYTNICIEIETETA